MQLCAAPAAVVEGVQMPACEGALQGRAARARGAFRFNTDVAARSRKRDVSVGIQTVTAIRGTDRWGRSRSDQQIVCLLEGAVEVGA